MSMSWKHSQSTEILANTYKSANSISATNTATQTVTCLAMEY